MTISTRTPSRYVAPTVWILMSLLRGVLSGQPADAPAPMYGLNTGNTGQSRLMGIASKPILAWTSDVIGTSPFPRNLALSGDGVLYGPGDALYAVDSGDGRIVWSASTGSRDSRVALDAQGRLYAFEDGRLQARNAANGALLWTGAPSSVSDGEPVKVGPDGTIYAPEIRGVIYAYRIDGTLKWQTEELGLIQYGEAAIIPAIDDRGNIYFGASRGYISLDPDGAERWRASRPAGDSSRVILGPDALLYYSAGGVLYVRDPSTGALLAQADGHDALQAMADDGTLFWTSNGAITATDSQGQAKWRYEREWIDWPLVVDAAGTVYGATQQGDIIALSTTGKLLWELHVTDNYPVLATCAPVIGTDGTIFVSTGDGLAAIVSENVRFHRGDPNNDGVMDVSDGICSWSFSSRGANVPRASKRPTPTTTARSTAPIRSSFSDISSSALDRPSPRARLLFLVESTRPTQELSGARDTITATECLVAPPDVWRDPRRAPTAWRSTPEP